MEPYAVAFATVQLHSRDDFAGFQALQDLHVLLETVAEFHYAGVDLTLRHHVRA